MTLIVYSFQPPAFREGSRGLPRINVLGPPREFPAGLGLGFPALWISASTALHHVHIFFLDSGSGSEPDSCWASQGGFGNASIQLDSKPKKPAPSMPLGCWVKAELPAVWAAPDVAQKGGFPGWMGQTSRTSSILSAVLHPPHTHGAWHPCRRRP